MEKRESSYTVGGNATSTAKTVVFKQCSFKDFYLETHFPIFIFISSENLG